MKQDDLNKYFNEILESEKYISSGAMDVLRQLIRLTLDYRDKMKAETGEILTVGDTRIAVDIYLGVIKTGRMPAEMTDRIGSLVKYWLQEINDVSF